MNPRPPSSIESRIQMPADTPLRWEVDHLNNTATIYFGPREEHVMQLRKESLRDLMATCARAIAELRSQRS